MQMYFKFVTDYKRNVQDVVNILAEYEIHFLPMHNPGEKNYVLLFENKNIFEFNRWL